MVVNRALYRDTEKRVQVKKVLQREKIMSPNDAWKGYLKAWDR